MENEYLEAKFKEWFNMPLNFDHHINDIIYQAALLSFKRGFLCPPPTLIDRVLYLFKTPTKTDKQTEV